MYKMYLPKSVDIYVLAISQVAPMHKLLPPHDKMIWHNELFVSCFWCDMQILFFSSSQTSWLM